MTKARYRASELPQDCGLCGTTDELQLHHMTYERVGEEELTDLTFLCARCHEMIHVLERRGDIGLDFSGLVSQRRAKRYEEDRGSTPVPVDGREKAITTDLANRILKGRALLQRFEAEGRPQKQLREVKRHLARRERVFRAKASATGSHDEEVEDR